MYGSMKCRGDRNIGLRESLGVEGGPGGWVQLRRFWEQVAPAVGGRWQVAIVYM